MKKKLLILLVALAFQGNAQQSLSELEWLIGSWNRTNAKPGRTGIEVWIKKSSEEFVGKGINLKGADTTFIEKLKIIIRNDKVYYMADVPENKEPVLFEMTALTGMRVTFENSSHDFPKEIVYELIGSKLKATISGNGKAIDYLFERR